MSVIYMLSGPGKNTGFPEKIKALLKNDLKDKKNVVFIPTSPDNFLRNDLYIYGDKKNIIGIIDYLNEISSLRNINIIDNRIKNDQAKKYIKKADVIYLLGGDPFSQLEYLRKEKYDKLINDFCGLIIGTSAGAMNFGKLAYCSKDEDFEESIFYDALGLVDITIDPHFDINNKEQVNEIIKNSVGKKIIGLPNESGIRITSNKVEFINKCYQFLDEKLEEIN